MKKTAASLLEDSGVLDREPVLEFFGFQGVARHGGLVVLPFRRQWLEAIHSGIEAVSLPEKAAGFSTRQAIVHLQKGRAATEEGLCTAWSALDDGGRLVLVGSNKLGIKTAISRLERELGQRAKIAANRAHSRVAVFSRQGDSRPRLPERKTYTFEFLGRMLEVETRPGVFSASRLDRGSALLLEYLETLGGHPRQVTDLGCGCGVLGIAAGVKWPDARLFFADHDRRAVEITARNAASHHMAERSDFRWWDALEEDLHDIRADLMLVNPPFHQGYEVDLDIPRAFIRSFEGALTRKGSAVIVANNTLPYEKELAGRGTVKKIREEKGFKLLRFTR